MNVGYREYAQYTPSFRVASTSMSNQASTSLPTKSNELHDIARKPVLSKDSANMISEKRDPSSDIQSFAYGALGMDHPNALANRDDDAYTAGQVLSAIGTIGAVLAVVV